MIELICPFDGSRRWVRADNDEAFPPNSAGRWRRRLCNDCRHELRAKGV